MKPYFVDEKAGITIYHGDCREILPELSAETVLSDPPYGVRSEAWDDMSAHEFARFTMEWLSVARRVTNEAVLFGTWDGPLNKICSMIYKRVRTMVWDKPVGSQFAGSSERGMWFASEAIFHAYDDSPDKSFSVAYAIKAARERKGMSRGGVDMALRGKKTGICFRWEEAACLPTPEQAEILVDFLDLDDSFKEALEAAYRGKAALANARDVFSHRTVVEGSHPCEKPLSLMLELISATTESSSSLIDPFMGTGTTLEAAKILGRSAIGIDKEERYCEMAIKRLAQEVLF